MSDLVSPPLKPDLVGGRRNNSGYPAVSMISTNGDVHAGDVDLLNDHPGELLRTAVLFHHSDLHPEQFPASPWGGGIDETGHLPGVRKPRSPRCQIAADSCRV